MSATGNNPGPKPQMTAAERALRNSAIMEQLHAREEVRQVARDHGLTAGQVRKIAASFEIKRTALEDRPMEIVERILRTYEDQMRNLALMAAENVTRAPQVALGALRARGDALECYVELLRDVGKLPDNLEMFKSESEILQLGRKVLDLLDDVAIGVISPEELREAVNAWMRVLAPAPVVEGDALELGPGES